MRLFESGDEFMDGTRYVFVQGEAWENMVVGEETNGFALAKSACVGTPDVKAAVMFWGASDITSL